MKNALWMLIAVCLLIGSAGDVRSADGGDKKPEASPGPVKEETASADSNKLDGAATQYLKKQRSINSELVAAYRELHRYNNPDKTSRGVNMADIVDQESALRETRRQEQATRNKKTETEERINSLQKDVENLKQDLLKHYNGKLPKHVSDAWQTEEGYAAYLISKHK